MPNRVQELVDQGEDQVSRQQWDDAGMTLEEAEELAYEEKGADHELLWKIDLLKARIRVGEGDLDLAEMEFDAAHEYANAIVEEIQFYRGMAYLKLGDRDQGIIELVCSMENGGEALFAEVDPELVAEVQKICDEG